MCTLPHAVALCLVKTPKEIVDFISKNPYSRAIGSPLVDSLISENQVAGVKASLSLPLTDLALPTIFWVMSANDVENYGDIITSSLLANLSYQMIGKANDPDSVRYYKNISEEIEKKTVSRSFGNSVMGGDTRTSEGTRETTKYKNQDFTRLKQGQFFVFADGKDKLYNFDLFPFKRLELKVKHHITEKDLNDNFNRIMEDVKDII